jgi:hypothetical protein
MNNAFILFIALIACLTFYELGKEHGQQKALTEAYRAEIEAISFEGVLVCEFPDSTD